MLQDYLSEKMLQHLSPRFKDYEVRNSLYQISARWKIVLTEKEKKKIARTLGGNRYSQTTYALLESLSDIIIEEKRG